MSTETYVKYAELIDTDKAKFVRKALDFMDGDQERYMIALLNSYGVGRTNWQTRGIMPRYRNITKMIVEKSGLLFTNTPPKIEIYTDGDMQVVDEQATVEYMTILNDAGWIDTFINLDQVVRLVKTSCLLVNYDSETDNVIFDILHRGNSQVLINENNREVMMVVYITGEYENKRSFRVITNEQYIDFTVDNQKQVSDVVEEDNPYGIVPVVPFYDTQKPRQGFWVEAPKDLIGMNEMYNIHLQDSEYCIKWEKYPTLFSNMTPSGSAKNIETYNNDSNPDVRTMLFGNGGTASAGNVGGPDRIVHMDGQGVDNPFIEYKAAQVDLTALDNVFDKWVKDFAYDWSVRVKTSGDGQATSGFQVVVEEMDNRQLREMRSRMFEQGMKKLYSVIAHIWNMTHGNVFSTDSVCLIEFAPANLPTDYKQEEEVWSIRINEGRASIVDYLCETQGYTKEDAENKVKEILAYKLMFGNTTPTVLQPEVPVEEDTVEEDTEEDVPPGQE